MAAGAACASIAPRPRPTGSLARELTLQRGDGCGELRSRNVVGEAAELRHGELELEAGIDRIAEVSVQVEQPGEGALEALSGEGLEGRGLVGRDGSAQERSLGDSVLDEEEGAAILGGFRGESARPTRLSRVSRPGRTNAAPASPAAPALKRRSGHRGR